MIEIWWGPERQYVEGGENRTQRSMSLAAKIMFLLLLLLLPIAILGGRAQTKFIWRDAFITPFEMQLDTQDGFFRDRSTRTVGE